MIEHVYTVSYVFNEGTIDSSKHLVGIFSNKESAIEECKSCISSNDIWVNNMEVPINVFILVDVDNLPKKGKYLGYSIKEWKKANDRFMSNNKSYRIMVEKEPLRDIKNNDIEIIYDYHSERYKPVNTK